MSFFLSPEITLGTKCLEVVFMIIGLVVIYTGIKSFLDKTNPQPIGTGIFWVLLGVLITLGRWIPPMASGVIVILMTIPAILQKVKVGKIEPLDPVKTKEKSDQIGMKVFIPAFSIGIFAILFAFTKLGALVGVGVGVFVAIIILMILSKDNTPVIFLEDSRRLMGTVGPLCMLPMLLASLGAIFTKAGVGQVVASLVGKIIPEGNMTVGIIVYALGMALFTMIMGNAFAAITVMTVGIGAPFVLAYGADPGLIVMVGLTCGFCGTLLTPMAANFNVVPVAMLDMKDKYGVIKNQALVAGLLLVFQIGYMILMK